MRQMLTAVAIIGLLGFAAAAELTLTRSAVHGHGAILQEGPLRIEVALSEGCRIVSWKMAEHEVVFGGRIWGGDGYDRYRFAEQSGDTRLLAPSSVEALRQDGLVALRARFQLANGVVLQRLLALNAQGLFVESSFAGTDSAWYEFAPHLARRKEFPLALLYPGDETMTLQPLLPKEDYSALPSSLALVGVPAWDLIWHCGEALHFQPRVWGDNLSFGLAGTFSGSPLRLSCQWQHTGTVGSTLPAAPAFPDCSGTWEPLTIALPDAPRPEAPAIAHDYGPYGVCNGDPVFMAPLAAAGIRWTRVPAFSWATCESVAGQRDNSTAEASLAAAEKEGMAVIGLMNGLPGWASTDGSRTAAPKDPQAWQHHVRQTVDAFHQRVHVWEIWNEPDIGQFWKGSAEDYVQLLRQAYQAAKEADPTCLIMSAGLDGSGEAFFARMLELGAGNAFDLVGVHPYASGVQTVTYRTRLMQRIMAFYGLNKPLWITEIGWQSGGWKGGPGVVASEEAKAICLKEAYPRLRELADVVCWYTGVEAGSMYGLMQPSGKAGFVLNPAWFAMRELAMPPAPGIHIESAAAVTLNAGQNAELAAIVQSDQTLQARWIGLEPEWGPATAIALPAGAPQTITAAIRLPAHLRPSQRHALLVVQDARGRHLANHVVALTIENPGRYCELKLSGDWVQRLDTTGAAIGAWTPAHQLGIAAGEGFVQPLRPANLGNAADRLNVSITGSAAPWLEAFPASIEVPAGERGWLGLRVRVPADAIPGSYTLLARLQSANFPEVQAEWQGTYSVIAAPDAAD